MPGRMGAGRPCRCAAPASTWIGLLSPVWATKAATSSGEKRLAAENTAPGSRGPAGAAAAAADPLAALPAAPANPLQPDTADAALPRHPPGPASSRDSCSAALWRVIGTAFQAGRRPRTSAPQPNTRNDGVLRSAEARALHMATGHTCSPAQPARHSKHAHHVCMGSGIAMPIALHQSHTWRLATPAGAGSVELRLDWQR